MLERLFDAFRLIVEHPRIGHARADVTDDERVRFWTVGPTVVAYRRNGETIVILLVERGERDWHRLIDDVD